MKCNLFPTLTVLKRNQPKMSESNLELSIYTFTLKERNRREDFYDFNEFYRKNFTAGAPNPHTVKPKKLYENFVGVILDEFDNKFWLNKEKNKGISSTKLEYRPGKDIIEGIINGGNTGYKQNIFDILNNAKTVGKITEKQLASLPYYFKIWTPPDSQLGVLMIQSYGIGSINSILVSFLKKFFAKYGATFRKSIHIPKEIRDDYLKRGSVKKVTYTTTVENTATRKKFNRAYEDSDGLRVTITVEGLKKRSISSFIRNFGKRNPIGIDLSEMGVDSPDDYETKLYYEDENGRKAHAKIHEKYEIAPTIVLPVEMIKKDKTTDFDKISAYTDQLLEKVKKEIDY